MNLKFDIFISKKKERKTKILKTIKKLKLKIKETYPWR